VRQGYTILEKYGGEEEEYERERSRPHTNRKKTLLEATKPKTKIQPEMENSFNMLAPRDRKRIQDQINRLLV
jgi:hypothetical protein